MADRKPQDVEEKPVVHGYTVGLTEDGEPIFQLVNDSNIPIVMLLGLHELATRTINKRIDAATLQGDTLVHEVGKGVKAINEQLLGLSAELENLVKELHEATEEVQETREE